METVNTQASQWTGKSMTPEQAVFLRDILFERLEKEFATNCRVLRAVPADQGSYRPHENSRSALELAWHLASSDIWFLDGFLAGKFEMEDDSMPSDIGEPADISATFEDLYPPKMEKVRLLSPEFWTRPIPFFGMFNLPAVMYLEFMLAHSIHHRGQLTAYLRPMGAKVPNIYGGSFDEPMQ